MAGFTGTCSGNLARHDGPAVVIDGDELIVAARDGGSAALLARRRNLPFKENDRRFLVQRTHVNVHRLHGRGFRPGGMFFGKECLNLVAAAKTNPGGRHPIGIRRHQRSEARGVMRVPGRDETGCQLTRIARAELQPQRTHPRQVQMINAKNLVIAGTCGMRGDYDPRGRRGNLEQRTQECAQPPCIRRGLGRHGARAAFVRRRVPNRVASHHAHAGAGVGAAPARTAPRAHRSLRDLSRQVLRRAPSPAAAFRAGARTTDPTTPSSM